MTEFIIALVLILAKFVASIFVVRSLPKNDVKKLMKKYFTLLGIKNLVLIGLAFLVIKFLDIDVEKFFIYLMIMYFLFLVVELFITKKVLGNNTK